MHAHTLSHHPAHLGLEATATIEPKFTGDMAWYGDYGARHASDGAEGRLVSQHSFSKPWDVWEMHPKGEEVVLCTAGTCTMYLEMPGGETQDVALSPGQYVIVPRGLWHTMDADGPVTAVFITAGLGTENRAR